MIRKRGNNSKTGESSKLLLYYCVIVKCMCLFFDQLTAICPIRYLGDSLQFLRIWYLVLHNTAYRPNVTQHWRHLYYLPEALWARDQKERRNLGAIISNAERLPWTLRPRPPLPPPSPLGKGPKWSLVCALWTLSPCPPAPLHSRDVPGEAWSLDGRSSFPNRKHSPSESKSPNNICNTSLWLFISHLAIFSHNLLTHYELNCSRINDTIDHLLCYFLEHFWSRIEVLHVCHLVLGKTNVKLHHIRNYSLFHEVWRLVVILRLWGLEG